MERKMRVHEGCIIVVESQRAHTIIARLDCAIVVDATADATNTTQDTTTKHIGNGCIFIGHSTQSATLTTRPGGFYIVIDYHSSFQNAECAAQVIIITCDAISALALFHNAQLGVVPIARWGNSTCQ